MAYVKTKLKCPKCPSTDAFAIDDGGWGTCFSCGVNVPPADIGEIQVEVKQTTGKIIVKHQLNIRAIPERKITLETAKLYKVGYKDDDLYFPLANGNAYKVRVKGEKEFRIEGDFNKSTTLFGQELFPPNGKRIVITEGEIDAMSLHQILGKYNVPVVSVRNGASAAEKDIKNNFTYLDSFDEVIFFFDSDKAGEEAVDKCANILSHKSKVVKGLPDYKDANDYLVGNNAAGAMKAFWGASKWTPQGIVSGKDLYDAVMKPLAEADSKYPFTGLNNLTYGIRKGELITITAGSGLGKSQFVKEIVYHILNTTEDNVGLIFLEESARKTGLSMMSLAANKPLHLPNVSCTAEEKQRAYEATLGKDRMFMLEHFGSQDIDSVVGHIRYFVKAVGCRYIFLDHVSMMVSGGEQADERKAIDEIMTKLRMLVEETGISLMLVSHLKRPDKKGHEEGAATSLSQLRGSGGIAQLSDMVIGLERNGQADDPVERNTTYARVLKNRFAGVTGKACALLYSLETGRMTETFEDNAL